MLLDIYLERPRRKEEYPPMCACEIPKDGSPACGDKCLNRFLTDWLITIDVCFLNVHLSAQPAICAPISVFNSSLKKATILKLLEYLNFNLIFSILVEALD